MCPPIGHLSVILHIQGSVTVEGKKKKKKANARVGESNICIWNKTTCQNEKVKKQYLKKQNTQRYWQLKKTSLNNDVALRSQEGFKMLMLAAVAVCMYVCIYVVPPSVPSVRIYHSKLISISTHQFLCLFCAFLGTRVFIFCCICREGLCTEVWKKAVESWAFFFLTEMLIAVLRPTPQTHCTPVWMVPELYAPNLIQTVYVHADNLALCFSTSHSA